MSKAFVREDDAVEDDAPLPVYATVPPGTKNYLTAIGVERIRGELTQLQEERSGLAVNTSDLETRQRIRVLEHRIRHLQQNLQTAEVLRPDLGDTDVVRFGASVIVRDERGVETRYRIVGVGEADFDRGEISWLSPLARALLNARAGARVIVQTPRGKSQLEIRTISYE